MPQEIELKARLENVLDFRTTLTRAGAVIVQPRELEDNWLLDDTSQHLIRRGENLRVRSAGGRAVLTWKGPKTVTGALRQREELELGCSDPVTLLDLFSRLGFKPHFRYQKFRETWTLAEVLVMVDETPAGNFAEIEGDSSSVLETAGLLGLEGDRLVADTYPALLLRWLAERGSGAREVLVDSETAPTQPKPGDDRG